MGRGCQTRKKPLAPGRRRTQAGGHGGAVGVSPQDPAPLQSRRSQKQQEASPGYSPCALRFLMDVAAKPYFMLSES